MAAWSHANYWDHRKYQEYRNYVSREAPKFKGSEALDCADISIQLLIDFAADNKLPVTFWDEDQFRYISKATKQFPAGYIIFVSKEHRKFSIKTWSSKEEFLQAVTDRIGARSLWDRNTVLNPSGPAPGDLMIKPDHVALVVQVWSPGVIHPKIRQQPVIPIFPGSDIAALQLNQTEYIFAGMCPGPPQPHFDYLNHRGEAGPGSKMKKIKKELIYYAPAKDPYFTAFQFRMYKPGVLDNWKDWNGIGEPPR